MLCRGLIAFGGSIMWTTLSAPETLADEAAVGAR
jgi:hypothetical protein